MDGIGSSKHPTALAGLSSQLCCRIFKYASVREFESLLQTTSRTFSAQEVLNVYNLFVFSKGYARLVAPVQRGGGGDVTQATTGNCSAQAVEKCQKAEWIYPFQPEVSTSMSINWKSLFQLNQKRGGVCWLWVRMRDVELRIPVTTEAAKSGSSAKVAYEALPLLAQFVWPQSSCEPLLRLREMAPNGQPGAMVVPEKQAPQREQAQQPFRMGASAEEDQGIGARLGLLLEWTDALQLQTCWPLPPFNGLGLQGGGAKPAVGGSWTTTSCRAFPPSSPTSPTSSLFAFFTQNRIASENGTGLAKQSRIGALPHDDSECEGGEKHARDRCCMMVRLQGNIGRIQLPPELWITLQHQNTVGHLYEAVACALRRHIPQKEQFDLSEGWFDDLGSGALKLVDPTVNARGPLEFVRNLPRDIPLDTPLRKLFWVSGETLTLAERRVVATGMRILVLHRERQAHTSSRGSDRRSGKKMYRSGGCPLSQNWWDESNEEEEQEAGQNDEEFEDEKQTAPLEADNGPLPEAFIYEATPEETNSGHLLVHQEQQQEQDEDKKTPTGWWERVMPHTTPTLLWSTKQTRQFEFHTSLNGSPEDVLLLGEKNGSVNVSCWGGEGSEDQRTGKPLFLDSGGPTLGLAWLRNHPCRAVAGAAHTGKINVLKYDHGFEDGTPALELLTQMEDFPQLSSLSVNSTDDFLLASGFTHDLAIYDMYTGQMVQRGQNCHSHFINISRFANNSPHILATASFDHTCKVWDLRLQLHKDRPTKVLNTGGMNVMCTFSPDDRYLLSTGVDTRINQYLVGSFQQTPARFPLRPAKHLTRYCRAVYFADSSRFVIGTTDHSHLRILESATGRNLGVVDFRGLLDRQKRASKYALEEGSGRNAGVGSHPLGFSTTGPSPGPAASPGSLGCGERQVSEEQAGSSTSIEAAHGEGNERSFGAPRITIPRMGGLGAWRSSRRWVQNAANSIERRVLRSPWGRPGRARANQGGTAQAPEDSQVQVSPLELGGGGNSAALAGGWRQVSGPAEMVTMTMPAGPTPRTSAVSPISSGAPLQSSNMNNLAGQNQEESWDDDDATADLGVTARGRVVSSPARSNYYSTLSRQRQEELQENLARRSGMLVSGRVWLDDESVNQNQAQPTPPVREFVQSVRTHPTDPDRFGVLLSSYDSELEEQCAYVGLVNLHSRYVDEDGDTFVHEEHEEEEEHGSEEGFGSSSSSSCGVSVGGLECPRLGRH